MSASVIHTLIVYLITFTSATPVTQSAVNDALRGTITDVINDLLNQRVIPKDVTALEENNERLRNRVQYLDEESRAKDGVIRELQANLNKMHIYLNEHRENQQERNTENEITENILKSFGNETKSHAIDGGYRRNREPVDSSVRIKRQIAIPNIAFTAILTHTHSHMVPGEAIKFNNVLLNDGHGYNAYTGAFTAALSGTYLFTFHIDARVHTFVRLTIDGHNVVHAVANPHTNTRDVEVMSGNTVAIHVGIGQVVLVEMYDTSGEAASSNTYRLCSFAGVFLYPEHLNG